jgi:hypothetical protein
VRVNFNYFISETVFDYILNAVHLVADHGWKLLPDYSFDPHTGIWHHRRGPAEPPLRLHDVHFGEDGTVRYPTSHDRAPESALVEYLDEGRRLLARVPPAAGGSAIPTASVSADFEALRWFELPPQCLTH